MLKKCSPITTLPFLWEEGYRICASGDTTGSSLALIVSVHEIAQGKKLEGNSDG